MNPHDGTPAVAMLVEPGGQVLYRFFDGAGNLLYIGITADVATRWSSHATTKAWWTEVATITIERFRTREEVEAAERAAIIAERPRYNITRYKKMAKRSGAGGSQATNAPVAIAYVPPALRFASTCSKCSRLLPGRHAAHPAVEMEWHAPAGLETKHRCTEGHEWINAWGEQHPDSPDICGCLICYAVALLLNCGLEPSERPAIERRASWRNPPFAARTTDIRMKENELEEARRRSAETNRAQQCGHGNWLRMSRSEDWVCSDCGLPFHAQLSKLPDVVRVSSSGPLSELTFSA